MSTEIDLANELAAELAAIKAHLNDSLRDILADEHESPVISVPTSLEIQMAEQLQEQARQMEEMKRMMVSLLEAEATRKADKERKAEAARKVEEMREAEITRRMDEKRREEAKRRAEELRKRRKEERQEDAKKRSAARIQAGEFNIWNRYGRHGFQALITGMGQHVWESDRTPITVDGKVCVGPRLGDYMGVKTESTPCGGGVIDGSISRSRYTLVNGVTYDGSVEPRLY